MKTVDSVCPLDCPDSCSIAVEVDGGRVVSIDGTPRNPVTGSYICAKVRRFPEAVHGPHRVATPLRRTGDKGEGAFRPVSWDEALGEIAGRLRQVRDTHGGEAILPLFYGGSNGYLSQGTTDARLFRRLGASRLARTVCSAPTGAASSGLYGNMAGVAYPDYARARLIVMWGVNPHASGIHILPFVQRAQRTGAKVVVVDPRRTKLAARADLHLAVRPGTDLPVALALIRWLFEHDAADREFLAAHCTGAEALRERAAPWSPARAAAEAGIDAGDIERLARWYAETSPAVIRCGWGLERNRNGGSAAAAVLALPAVAGKFGIRGGGYTLTNSPVWGLSSEPGAAEPVPDTRLVNMNRVGRVLDPAAESPVRFLFVYNNNGLMTLPEQERVRRGLLRGDLFTVVFDSFLTDTARYADVVLPAATFLERRELARGYGAYAMQRGVPVIPPVGESRTNHEVFADLCARLDLDRPGDPRTEEEVETAVLGAHPEGARYTRELDEAGIALPASGVAPVQFGDIFPGTPDGKVHLVPGALDAEAPLGLYGYRGDPATAGYPLALISPASAKMVTSTLGQLYPDPWPMELHPDDAAPRGIVDGDTVRVFNDLGEVVCRVRVTGALRPGVASLAKGIWSHHTFNGRTANALCPDTLTDLAGGACFNDARVQVERHPDPPVPGNGAAR